MRLKNLMGLQNLVKVSLADFVAFKKCCHYLMLIFLWTSFELWSLKTGIPATAAGSLFAIYPSKRWDRRRGKTLCLCVLWRWFPLAVFFNFITKFYEV